MVAPVIFGIRGHFICLLYPLCCWTNFPAWEAITSNSSNERHQTAVWDEALFLGFWAKTLLLRPNDNDVLDLLDPHNVQVRKEATVSRDLAINLARRSLESTCFPTVIRALQNLETSSTFERLRRTDLSLRPDTHITVLTGLWWTSQVPNRAPATTFQVHDIWDTRWPHDHFSMIKIVHETSSQAHKTTLTANTAD